VVVALPLRNPVDVVVTREGASAYLKLSIEEQPEEFGLAPIRD
jgi:hypothetical protein